MTAIHLPIQTSDRRWREHAKCQEPEVAAELITSVSYRGDDVWFPKKGENATKYAKLAKRICNGEDGRDPCPVKAQCREFALSRNEKYGIWGGLSEQERNRIRRARRRILRQRGKRLVRT